MNIFNEPLTDITFKDVADFCGMKVLEGVNLEYKSDFPRNAKDLAKQFVTFSNTQGGIVIIGVDEDNQGYPKDPKGVVNDGKLVDRIHQIAVNIIPLPNYEVVVTDEVKSRAFVLIRIHEGAAPPYSTMSDPTPWIRTGNISTPVRAANREELLQLLHKRTQAKDLRDGTIAFAEENYKIDLREAERERNNLIANGETNTYKEPLGAGYNAAMLSASFVPLYPEPGIIKIEDISQRLHELYGQEYFHSPLHLGTGHSIPGGYSGFSWNHHAGTLSSGQIYTNGHIYSCTDVLRTYDNQRIVNAYAIGHELHHCITAASNVYGTTKYNGQIHIKLRLEGGEGAITQPPIERMVFHDSFGSVKFPRYEWEATTDTQRLAGHEGQKNLHIQLMKDICWGLGLGDIHDSHLIHFFEQNGWYGLKRQ